MVFLLRVALRAVKPFFTARGVHLCLDIRDMLAHVKIDAKFTRVQITDK